MSDYYARHSREYFDRTIHIDPGDFLEPLAKRLEKGARVLDVGCGSGRDLSWMKNRGFMAQGLERSSGLVGLARETSGCEVMEGDFETWDFSTRSVDAILLITALVHVPHERLRAVLSNIIKALKPGGWLLVSMKRGRGRQTDERGRDFYLWESDKLEGLLCDLGFQTVETAVSRSAMKTGEALVSLLAKKQ